MSPLFSSDGHVIVMQLCLNTPPWHAMSVMPIFFHCFSIPTNCQRLCQDHMYSHISIFAFCNNELNAIVTMQYKYVYNTLIFSYELGTINAL